MNLDLGELLDLTKNLHLQPHNETTPTTTPTPSPEVLEREGKGGGEGEGGTERGGRGTSNKVPGLQPTLTFGGGLNLVSDTKQLQPHSPSLTPTPMPTPPPPTLNLYAHAPTTDPDPEPGLAWPETWTTSTFPPTKQRKVQVQHFHNKKTVE